ncbi:TerD family protein [Nocardia asteroides]|uniref:TerD family protein n=1 Tax=Nocardia asteroides TaxID=1824 RepID=UPI0037CA8A59
MAPTIPTTADHTLELVRLGLGWAPGDDVESLAPRENRIDLNAAALSFAGPAFVDAVFHERLISHDGALRHLGDSVTGEGAGDNEVIVGDLTRVHPSVTSIVFLVTCYTGQRFDTIRHGFCRVVDAVAGTELVRVDLDHVGAATGLVFGALHRGPDGWRFTLIGEPIEAEHAADAVPQLTRYLR